MKVGGLICDLRISYGTAIFHEMHPPGLQPGKFILREVFRTERDAAILIHADRLSICRVKGLAPR